MFCGKCGSTVRDGAAFCPKCGNKFSFSVPAEPVVSEPIPAAPTINENFAEQTPVSSPVRSESQKEVVKNSAKPAPEKKSSVPVIIFIILGILLIAGIGFGVWFIANSGDDDEVSSVPSSVPAAATPSELFGRWEYNVSYTELPIGKPFDTAFDTQLSEVRYRLSVEFGEDSKAYLLLYKADIESAATGIYDIFHNYRINELYQSYYNSNEFTKEQVEYVINETQHMTVGEYIAGQMKSVGLDKESILKKITAGLPELDGRTWIYMECKYTIGDGIVTLETNNGESMISFVTFLDDNKIKPYEANETFAFLVKDPGEEISFLKKNK